MASAIVRFLCRGIVPANNFLRWFMMAFAAWSSKKVFDATVSPFTQWFFDRWYRKTTEIAASFGVPQT